MKKILAGTVVLLSSLFSSFAGDSAVLVDNGFSKDGKFYVFGQYGKTDKSFEAWADIYIVDVAKNDYIDDGDQKILPSTDTKNKSGKEVYETLAGKTYKMTKKYGCEKAKPDQVLYIREDDKKSSTDEIVFKDFVSSLSKDQGTYHVVLSPEYKTVSDKNGVKNVKSSFYITVEKQDSKGNVLARQKFGTPSISRKNVTNYRIEKIVCDPSGKNLVFIIEKKTEDKTGTNIRYMIEAGVLNSQFFTNLAPADENAMSAEENEETDENEEASVEVAGETAEISESETSESEDEPIVLESVSYNDAK